jgi:hypothetical protein
MFYSMFYTMFLMLWEVPATLASVPGNDHVESIYMYLHIDTLEPVHAWFG